MKLEHNFFAIYGNDPDLMNAGTYKITMPELGLHIEKRMKDLRMTQMEFATAIGIARSDVNRILRKISFDTDKLRVISDALNYNFFKDFYSAKNDSLTKEQQNEQSNMGMILRLEELAGENRLQKQEIENLKKENLYLKTKLIEAGIEF